MADYPPAALRLVAALRKLPGIGPRSAERLALHLLSAPPGAAKELAHALQEARNQIHPFVPNVDSFRRTAYAKSAAIKTEIPPFSVWWNMLPMFLTSSAQPLLRANTMSLEDFSLLSMGSVPMS